MSDTHHLPKLGAQAIHVAWKSRGYLYRVKDGDVRALRRVCKGLTADEARKALATGELVLQEAIRLIEPRDLAILEEYRSRVPNGPRAPDMANYERQLALKFPDFTADAFRAALQMAVIYHIL